MGWGLVESDSIHRIASHPHRSIHPTYSIHSTPPIHPSTHPSHPPTRPQAERRKAKQLKEEQAVSQRLLRPGVIANGVCLLLTYALFLYLVTRVWSDAEIAQFDPYAILEIAHDADDRTIRKAYRRLSLQWHPDKNLGNQYAEQMFMMVRKAYEALTDEVAKENWQKYGNPDGKQALEVSIGLPTFLLDKKNHTTILLVYLVFLVVAIPLGALAGWHSIAWVGLGSPDVGVGGLLMGWGLRMDELTHHPAHICTHTHVTTQPCGSGTRSRSSTGRTT